MLFGIFPEIHSFLKRRASLLFVGNALFEFKAIIMSLHSVLIQNWELVCPTLILEGRDPAKNGERV